MCRDEQLSIGMVSVSGVWMGLGGAKGSGREVNQALRAELRAGDVPQSQASK